MRPFLSFLCFLMSFLGTFLPKKQSLGLWTSKKHVLGVKNGPKNTKICWYKGVILSKMTLFGQKIDPYFLTSFENPSRTPTGSCRGPTQKPGLWGVLASKTTLKGHPLFSGFSQKSKKRHQKHEIFMFFGPLMQPPKTSKTPKTT